MPVTETPKASWPHDLAAIDETVVYLKRTWCELSGLAMVRIWTDRLRVYDVNGDCFEVTGIGYGDAQIVKLLDMGSWRSIGPSCYIRQPTSRLSSTRPGRVKMPCCFRPKGS